MKKRLSKSLKALIKAYLDHRDNQSPANRWNKEQDCDAIALQARLDNFVRCEQCCGTWWFSVRRGKNIWVFECDEDNYTTTLTGIKRDVSSNALTKLFG